MSPSKLRKYKAMNRKNLYRNGNGCESYCIFCGGPKKPKPRRKNVPVAQCKEYLATNQRVEG